MATAEIQKCNCTQKPGTTGGADYQDQLYGKGQRVHNCTTSKTGGKVAVCTVCGTKK